MSTSHRAGGGSNPPGYPQRRPPSPNPLATWGRTPWLGIGSFLGGLVAVIVAVIIHDHAAYPNMVCNTGLGELGQAFSNTVQVDCGVATTAESTVGWLVFFGVAGIVIGLGKMGLSLAGGNLPPAQALGWKLSSPPAAQAPPAPQAAPAPYGYAGPAAPPAAQYPVPPPAPGSPAMPERPAAWAPPPPPPGSNWSGGSGAPLWPEPDQYGR